MKEIVGDLFKQKCDAICITTNGYVDRQGYNVMGAGVAGAAKHLWSEIPATLGDRIMESGHQVHRLTLTVRGQPHLGNKPVPYHIVAFPTKPELVEDVDDLIPRYYKQYADYPGPIKLPGWMGKSTTDLIMSSCQELVKLTNAMPWDRVVLPKPGCANGGLSWEQDVRPIVSNLLDDRFLIIDRR